MHVKLSGPEWMHRPAARQECSDDGRIWSRLEEGLDLLGRQRSGEEEALPDVAALGLQLGQLAGLFDPLGEGLEVHGLAQLYQGVDEGVSLG